MGHLKTACRNRLCLQRFDRRVTARRKFVGDNAPNVVFQSELVYNREIAAQVCEHFDTTAIWPFVVTHRRVLFIVSCKRDWRTRAEDLSHSR